MNIKKFIKRIVCLGISSVLITSNSFAEQIITNSSKKPQKQLKNNITKSKLDSLLEKFKNLSSEQKKKILLYASKLSLKAFVTGSTILFINKLLNILFPDESDTHKSSNQTQPNLNLNKRSSPFANLEWKNNNCYIDATLQILYEDPEFRKYVEDNANSKENQEKKYVYLSQIFKDMDTYKGHTVPHNQARKDFERALGHIGPGCCDDVFGTVFPSAIKYYLCNDCDTNEFKIIEADQEIEKYFKDFSGNSLWFLCNATSTENRKTLPLELNLANNKTFKLKGVVVLTKGFFTDHYNAYKTDISGQWYYIDDKANCNQRIEQKFFLKDYYHVYTEPNFKLLCTDKHNGVALAYYQVVENQ